MQPAQARRELANLLIAADENADKTAEAVLEYLDNLRDQLSQRPRHGADQSVAVHDSAEFLAWLRS